MANTHFVIIQSVVSDDGSYISQFLHIVSRKSAINISNIVSVFVHPTWHMRYLLAPYSYGLSAQVGYTLVWKMIRVLGTLFKVGACLQKYTYLG